MAPLYCLLIKYKALFPFSQTLITKVFSFLSFDVMQI